MKELIGSVASCLFSMFVFCFALHLGATVFGADLASTLYWIPPAIVFALAMALTDAPNVLASDEE